MGMFPRANPADAGSFELNITSMVDILTIITMYLTFSFAVNDTSIKPLSDIALPQSTSRLAPPQTLKLSVSATAVRIDNQLVMALRGGQFAPGEVDAARRVIPLYRALQREKLQMLTGTRTQVDLQDDSHAGETVYVEAAKGLSYGVIVRVLRTAAAAGFTTFRLAVNQKE